MRPRSLVAVLTVLSLSPRVAESQTQEVISRIDSVFAQLDNVRSPGCALGVRHESLELTRGYGMANLELGVAIAPSSVFRIGSVSKQFTAAAIVDLAHQGKLSIDDAVTRFLPEMMTQRGRNNITIRHLLNHTSGVRDYLTLMSLAGKSDDDFYTTSQALASIERQQETNFTPGSEFLYSNSGYLLLSEIVRRAGGMSLREYAQRRLFEPFSMRQTHFHDDHRHLVANRASGYRPTSQGGFEIDMTTLEMVGDGGVYTTVGDLLIWVDRLWDGTDRSNAMLRALSTRGVLTNGDTIPYALGLRHDEHRGLQTIGHSGGFVGFRADLVRFPNQNLTVVALCNSSIADPSRLTRAVAGVLLEDQMQPAAPERQVASGADRTETDTAPRARLPVDVLRRFAGEYYSPELDVVYSITTVDGALHLGIGGATQATLELETESVFRARGLPLTLRFQREDGEVSGFLLDAGRVENLRFARR